MKIQSDIKSNPTGYSGKEEFMNFNKQILATIILLLTMASYALGHVTGEKSSKFSI